MKASLFSILLVMSLSVGTTQAIEVDESLCTEMHRLQALVVEGKGEDLVGSKVGETDKGVLYSTSVSLLEPLYPDSSCQIVYGKIDQISPPSYYIQCSVESKGTDKDAQAAQLKLVDVIEYCNSKLPTSGRGDSGDDYSLHIIYKDASVVRAYSNSLSDNTYESGLVIYRNERLYKRNAGRLASKNQLEKEKASRSDLKEPETSLTDPTEKCEDYYQKKRAEMKEACASSIKTAEESREMFIRDLTKLCEGLISVSEKEYENCVSAAKRKAADRVDNAKKACEANEAHLARQYQECGKKPGKPDTTLSRCERRKAMSLEQSERNFNGCMSMENKTEEMCRTEKARHEKSIEKRFARCREKQAQLEEKGMTFD